MDKEALETEGKERVEETGTFQVNYHDLYENAPDMLVSIDLASASITHCNQTLAANLGYTKEELLGKPVFLLYHPDCLNNVLENFQFFVETGAVKNSELVLERKDGSRVDVILNASAVRDEAGHILYSHSCFRDITQLKQAQRKIDQTTQVLIQAEKLTSTGTMAAGIAHELNNPMMGILNYIQYARKSGADTERHDYSLQQAEQEIKRCIKILGSLLTFSQGHHHTAESFQPLSCAVLMDRALQLLEYRIREEQIALQKWYSDELPDCFVRGDQIQQVFLNLLINAIDAMKESAVKTLSVKVKSENAMINIQITDTGQGIKPEIIQKIFDPFFTTKPPGKGTGLGLSVCHTIVESHGGEIRCYSVSGKSTTFTVLLPIAKTQT